MCLITTHVYKCGHENSYLSTTYIIDEKFKKCFVEGRVALDRSCSKIEEHTRKVCYKCVRCSGSLNWSKDYQQTNGHLRGRYFKDSSHG